MNEDWFELVMGYAEKVDEACMEGETLQFWEYLEEFCGVICEGDKQDEDMCNLLLRFYTKETISDMVSLWSQGKSYAR